MVTTDDLTKTLLSQEDLDRYFSAHAADMLTTDLTGYLNALLEKHQMQKADLVSACWLERSYVYQLFSGARRNPSRDTLLAIALGMHLTLDETQTLLRVGIVAPLLPRIRRDAVLMKAIAGGCTLRQCNDMLMRYHEKTIG